eukprot:EG_transcript_41884
MSPDRSADAGDPAILSDGGMTQIMTVLGEALHFETSIQNARMERTIKTTAGQWHGRPHSASAFSFSRRFLRSRFFSSLIWLGRRNGCPGARGSGLPTGPLPARGL